jgi:hypothetical protein
MDNLFVDYKQALSLKEIGYVDYSWFGMECSLYKADGKHTFYANGVGDDTYISAPLKTEVLQWFRDKHQLYGEVLTDCTTYPKFCYTHTEFFGNPNDLTEKEWGWENNVGQYSLLYRSYPEAESELINYLIQKINK